MKLQRKIKSAYTSWKVAAIFLLPFMAFYSLFTLYPLLKGVVMSLYKGRFGTPQTFCGLSNYILMFQDKYFWGALGNTLWFVVVSTPIVVAFGLIFALVANSGHRFSGLVKVAAFLPYVLSISVISKVWVYIFKPYTGLLNNVMISLHLTDKQTMWFDTPFLAWTTIIVATLWWTVGFNTILFLSGLQEIPTSLYEASALDGAGKWQQFTHITVPSLKGVTIMIVLLQIISSFKLFGQPWLMTGGGPGRATRPLVQYIYQTGFNNWDSGYASAMSYALLVIMILVSFLYNKIFYRREERQ
ncbi:MAG: sugar ABC transporter permease [Angelakisella sp.]